MTVVTLTQEQSASQTREIIPAAIVDANVPSGAHYRIALYDWNDARELAYALRAEFDALADEWHRETGHLSSPVQIAIHPAYQRIIALGDKVIPFILEDLRDRGGQWYWALEALTGESPVPPDAAGRIPVLKQAWLEWGRHRGYID